MAAHEGPARTAASELATALPVSLCAWMPRFSPGIKRATSHFAISETGKKQLIRDDIKLEDYERTEQAYEPNTAVLRTRMYDRKGQGIEVTDLAPRFWSRGRTFRQQGWIAIGAGLAFSLLIYVCGSVSTGSGRRSRRRRFAPF